MVCHSESVAREQHTLLPRDVVRETEARQSLADDVVGVHAHDDGTIRAVGVLEACARVTRAAALNGADADPVTDRDGDHAVTDRVDRADGFVAGVEHRTVGVQPAQLASAEHGHRHPDPDLSRPWRGDRLGPKRDLALALEPEGRTDPRSCRMHHRTLSGTTCM